MTSTQIKKLEAKIDKLDQKLDFVIHHYTQIDTQEDWIDDPKLSPLIDDYISQAEQDIQNGKIKQAKEVKKALGL